MSESDVEIAKEAWAALQARDLSGFLERTDPEIEFNSLVAEAEGGTFRGHDGVREWEVTRTEEEARDGAEARRAAG